MGDDDRDDGQDGDTDRAAILARRQRFIAMALTGLAATAAGCDNGKGKTSGSGAAKPPTDEHPTAPSQPCLKVRQTPSPDRGTTAAPTPCLEVSVPASSEGDDGQADDGQADDDQADDGPAKPPPQPCLRVRKPEPAPTPCLNVVMPEPTPQPGPAKPRPCLKIRKPD